MPLQYTNKNAMYSTENNIMLNTIGLQNTKYNDNCNTEHSTIKIQYRIM